MISAGREAAPSGVCGRLYSCDDITRTSSSFQKSEVGAVGHMGWYRFIAHPPTTPETDGFETPSLTGQLRGGIREVMLSGVSDP